MELTASHAIQGIMVVVTLAGGYAVVKSNLSRVIADLSQHIKNNDIQKTEFDRRLDDAESQRLVFANQIQTLIDINSVSALERRNREIADIQARLKVIETQVKHLYTIHNGEHIPTRTKT